MLTIYIDADACPVKDAVYRVARRAVRHPVNGYRLFKRDDLDALLKKVAQVTGKSSRN